MQALDFARVANSGVRARKGVRNVLHRRRHTVRARRSPQRAVVQEGSRATVASFFVARISE
eukprot:COSAG02_NODE_55615_length_289_cov_1.089474_1_plen_60_part_10